MDELISNSILMDDQIFIIGEYDTLYQSKSTKSNIHFVDAAKNGQLLIFVWLYNNITLYDQQNQEIIMYNNEVEYFRVASSTGRINIIDWLFNNGYADNIKTISRDNIVEEIFIEAIINDRENVLDYLVKNNMLKNIKNITDNAATLCVNNNRYELLEWLSNNNFSTNFDDTPDKSSLDFYIKNINMIKKSSLELKKQYYTQAAATGDLESLQWLFNNVYYTEYDPMYILYIIRVAASNNRINVLSWLFNQNYINNNTGMNDMLEIAITEGHTRILDFMLNNNLLIFFEDIDAENFDDTTNFMREQAPITAMESDRRNVLQWLFDHNYIDIPNKHMIL